MRWQCMEDPEQVIELVLMRYFSTRGDSTERLSFEDAVLTGLAPDGGLYIPERIPTLPADWQTAWASFTFQQLSVEVLSLFISPSEIARSELEDLVRRSYSTFRHADVTPLVRLSADGRTHILELFHGPTFAFKDVALQLLGNLFEFLLARRNARGDSAERHRLTVLGATSGDTGSAAIYGLRGKRDIDIFILHPKGRVSLVQEAQMTTVLDANVHNLAVKGTFDDCQDIVKALFADTQFNAKHKLGAINSINWARILAQTVYYFHAYFTARRQVNSTDAELQFVVPTGNFGDVLAGYYAKRMGVPMAKLVVATNANDILARFWASGRYEKVASSDTPVDSTSPIAPAQGASDGKQATADASGVLETLSPAMDILVSSNFERLLWYLAQEARGGEKGVAGADVRGWMASVKSDGRAVVPTKVLDLARETSSLSESATSRLRKLSPMYPHTAVALAAAKRLDRGTLHQIVLSTAHPAKFSDAVTRALSSTAPTFDFNRDVLPDEFKGLLDLPRRVTDVEAPRAELVKEAMERQLVKRPGAVEEGSSV
ncbi:tryptophan synthase beta subunit-like PLP-dependent enzyme [Auriculariales sp. MPI-PUGE-AT-0066]|nr:tryptophan synthase beta subunit-like PLP-dependent enzyme [Auriculariales sp. MPI-PUGE-AT-0066]